MQEKTLRRAPQNGLYRLVEFEDIAPGAVFYSTERKHVQRDPNSFLLKYRLDDDPVIEVKRGGITTSYVSYYHVDDITRSDQHFVTLAHFLGEREPSEYRDEMVYWLPINT